MLERLKPHLHALKNKHGTPNFWHRASKILSTGSTLHLGPIRLHVENRPFALWRHFTTTTRILFVFSVIFKFGNPRAV